MDTVTPMTEAFYEAIDEHTYQPTVWTCGPWGPDSQHGGPPAALLGRQVEALQEGTDLGVARITFDILRPLPIEPMRVEARVVRPGRRVQLVEAEIRVGDDVLMRASAWSIRREDDAVRATDVAGAPDPPSGGEAVPLFATGYEGYLQAMEWRFVEGSFLEPGPATAWLRMDRRLVAGEEPSPLARVLTASDSASGISAALDFRDWLFVNPDLSVYLTRVPRGDWVCLQAATSIDADGVGLTTSTIFDEEGALGRTLQSLYVARRG